MKELIKTNNVSRFEFWAATAILVFFIFGYISFALSSDWNAATVPGNAEGRVLKYNFTSGLLEAITVYLAFLLLNFVVVPRLIKKEAIAINITLIIAAFVVTGFIFGITNTFLRYNITGERMTANHNYIFQKNFLYALWLLFVFVFYTVIKYSGIYLLSRSEDIRSKYPYVTPGGLTAFVAWMIVLLFMLVGGLDRHLIGFWAIMIPYGIAFYWYSLYVLIPVSLKKKKPFRAYLLRAFLYNLATTPVVSILGLLIAGGDEAPLVIAFLNAVLSLLVTVPLSWIVYKRLMEGNKEINILRSELGRSNANLDFLRSQINPHFLFNALNTIYGTALHEKAERTSEGIEKLGDMMRFMLQENMQDKISLSREIDYLNNYISLQKLRTDSNPMVSIQSVIDQQPTTLQIAPMLLIPFVENAFKHGISLREPSHIKVSLETKGKTIYFDVFNSIHTIENDPEKDKSGIGLTNVRQRLQLLYPGKHELIIRETGKDFFVHLTINLS